MSNPHERAFDSIGRPAPAWARWLAAGTALTRRILPQRCLLCVAPAGDALLCPACEQALPRLPPGCPVCALPSAAGAICNGCLMRPPPYAATIAAFAYAFPVDRLVREFKYRGTLALADWAAAKLVAAVRAQCTARGADARVDGIVALPLAKGRQRERGFNQAREIAARVARELPAPVLPALVRVGNGPPQAGLAWGERRRNVRGAFDACAEVDGAHLALVDDVMTTGATLAEATRALRNAGAARVECWVVARTLRPEAA